MNLDDIYHSVCAFANDFDNVGGGYILIGVEEESGVAVRPIKGLEEQEIDKIQKEILGYNNTIIPAYFPKVIIEEVDKKTIMILWVQRPYKVPEHVTAKKEKKHYYYIRYASNSVHANPEQKRELVNITNYAPLDTRPNFDATENDISVALLIDHLNETKSKLAKQVTERGVMAVLNDMQLLVGPPEQQYISNVALMMFCEHLDKFFPYTQVEIVRFPDWSVKNPNNFKGFLVIKGSVTMMIKRTMQTLQDLVIEVEPELIRIISFPGIDRSIPRRVIEEGERFSSRYYRNRRLGEFLKELDLSEGKSTGIPTIQEELRNNGSPKAKFFTDDDRRAVTVEIPIHPDFLNKDEPQSEIKEQIIRLVNENSHIRRKEMTEKIETTFDGYTVWLSIDQMAELFQRDKSTISIYSEELVQEATVQNEGNRQVERSICYYNLDVIISGGYRVKSKRGTQPTLREAVIAKNYLNEKNFVRWNSFVSGYLDFAERQAERERAMTMEDWAKHLDRILIMSGEQLLSENGSVTYEQAVKKTGN